MATRRYSIQPGDAFPHGITEAVGAAVVTKPIELTIDLVATAVEGNRAITKLEVIRLLEHLQEYILQGPWPPA